MPDALLIVLDVVLVVVAARCGGAVAVRLGEPRIAGEMIGAILVGPTVLGGQIAVDDTGAAGGVVGSLFPASGVAVLTGLGAVGMILYMLLIGMGIDASPMARRACTILMQALGVVAAACAVSLVAAAWLGGPGGGWQGADATDLAFLLGLSAALAAQGVPIAARILEERGLMRTEVGGMVIAIGACVMTIALLVSAIAIRGGDRAAGAELALTLAAGALVVAVAAPRARSSRLRLGPRLAVATLLAIALAAGFGGKALLGTILIGPLVVGIAVRNAGFSADVLDARLATLVRGVLLPVFLGVAALHANLRELGHLDAWPQAVALIAAVVVAKTMAGVASARAAGFSRREAQAMGALLQCGGVMTIAISLDLVQAGIFTTRTHALMTLVGLVTALLAGPLLARSRLPTTIPTAAPPGAVAPAFSDP